MSTKPMAPIPEDYEVPSGSDDNFSAIPDGTYTVEALSVFSTDDNGDPIVIEDPFGGVWPIARAGLQVSGEDDMEVPVSFRLQEAPLIVNAFGGDLNALPPIPPLSDMTGVTDYLRTIEKLCNSGTKTPNIVSGRGWGKLYKMSGYLVPRSMYTLKVVDIDPRDNDTGLPIVRDGQYGKHFFATLEIVGDQYGNRVPFSGAHYTTILPYMIVTTEEGNIDFPKYKGGPHKGKYTPTGKAFSRFLVVACPSFYEGGIQDIQNVLPEVWAAIQSDKKTFVAYIGINDKGYNNFDLSTVEQFTGQTAFPVAAAPTPSADDTNGVVPDHHLGILRDFVIQLGQLQAKAPVDMLVGESGFKLTKEGGTIVKKIFGPLKGELSTNDLNQFTPDDVSFVFENMSYEGLKDNADEIVAGLYDQLQEDNSGAF